MNVSRRILASHFRMMTVVLLLACAIAWEPGQAVADGIRLPQQTKLRVTVLQWMPMKGVYEEWTALGGEFVVSNAGTIVLPVVGTVSVGTMDTAGLAEEISTRIQAKTELVSKPDTTVQVLEYPPIYVVGDVTKPGEYQYRPGLTVLQAIALSGGELQPSESQATDEIRLVGELQGYEAGILRAEARIARLQAEMTGSPEISFPALHAGEDSALAAEVFGQERIIFAARANEIDRQSKSLSELRDLFSAEIDVLEEKIKSADMGIKSAEQELNAVKTLVDKGLAIASRQSDLERALANYRADRLDQVTAIMRARQNITESTRNLEGLHDKQQTEVAAQMQNEQANLDQLKLTRDISQKLLLDLLAKKNRLALSGTPGGAEMTIKRHDGGVETVTAASESTLLGPGDVVEVKLAKGRAGLPDMTNEASLGKAPSDGASQ
ncbi:polysaccharide biosynthesis/export family protein [Mesorhizobium sp.]|jgi:polysaccharide export outer membrane protein|uniref:polysaccharide biosynthesis/export family protein n=1 Tax=Mesorhizobium sp. TaxID=1871066 RepID=UPI003564DF51